MSTEPNLSEQDARTIARHIITEIQKMGGTVTQFGVHLWEEGFWFVAHVNGYEVHARTGEGNFTYKAVAAELLHTALGAKEVLSDRMPVAEGTV